ncbi:444_t:CDS:2, partial [Gigaspora rosea]
LVRKHSGTDILIRNNPAFLNNSKHLPRPAWQQLVVTLERLVGLGIGTVVEYTKRIVTAINSIGNAYVQWPDSIEQQQLSEFKGYVGFLDGTDVVLEYKPLKD